MRVLVITKIFPNALEPLSSPFNRQQFAALARLCDVEVLATIPWFPGAALFRRWSAAGRLAGVPAAEVIDGLPVAHPRTLFVPRHGHAAWGALYAASILPAVWRRRRRCDVVLGSWAYPDGAAAITLAGLLGVPAVIKVHGSDINVHARRPAVRRRLARMLPRAARVVAVSRALAAEVAALGVAPERVVVVGNGVDGELFRVRDRAAARRGLGLAADGKWIVYVGRLQREKGTLDLLDAYARLPGEDPPHLALIGSDGGVGAACRAFASRHPRVSLVGARPLAEVPEWMAAADVVTLPSWNEGTPNVVLEALACGRPVVATDVGGIPDSIDSPLLGALVPRQDPAALARALADLLGRPHDAAAIAAAGNRGGWADSARRLHDVLRDAVAEKRAAA